MPKLSLQKGERLIAEIRANEVLYDSSHINYSDLALKTRVWGQVASRCGMRTAHEAKLMWKNLRDCYRICRSKLNENPNTRTWRFYNQMDFLAPYIKYRKSVGGCAFASPMAEVISAKDKDNSPPPKDGRLDITDTAEGFTTVFYWDDDDAKGKEMHVSNEVQPAKEDVDADVRSRLQSPFDTDSFEDVLPEALQEDTSNSSLKMFFDAMYASTSGLPVRVQRSVKKKIFTAVLEAEEEAENLRDKSPPRNRIKVEP